VVHYGKKGYAIKRKSQPYTPRPKPTISVFTYYHGLIELYMDGEKIREHIYRGYPERKNVLKEWDIWMRNLYFKRVFYISITKKVRHNDP